MNKRIKKKLMKRAYYKHYKDYKKIFYDYNSYLENSVTEKLINYYIDFSTNAMQIAKELFIKHPEKLIQETHVNKKGDV